MDCRSFELWISDADESEILSPGEPIQSHIAACSSCHPKYQLLKNSLFVLNEQKSATLPEFTSQRIIGKLQDMAETINFPRQRRKLRLAVSLVVAFGVLSGILAGHLYTRLNNTESSIWENEFAAASDNTASGISFFEY